MSEFVYKQRITKTSKGVLFGIVGLVGILTLACWVGAFLIFFFTSDSLIGLLPLAVGVILFLLFRFCLKELKKQTLQTDVREIKDGAVNHMWRNDETGEVIDTRVPFEEITAIYIARHAIRVGGTKHSRYSIFPQLVVEWEDEGEKRYISFIEGKVEKFYALYEQFPVEDIPVYSANINLHMWPDGLMHKVIEANPMREVESKYPLKLPFKVREVNYWMSPPVPNIHHNEDIVKKDKKKFNRIGTIVFAISMIIILYSLITLLPQWPVEDEMFNVDETILITLIYIFPLLFFFHVRKKWNLHWLLLQMAIVSFVYLLSGWIVTQIHQVHIDFNAALYVEIFMACLMVLMSYIVGRLIILFVVIHEKIEDKRR